MDMERKAFTVNNHIYFQTISKSFQNHGLPKNHTETLSTLEADDVSKVNNSFIKNVTVEELEFPVPQHSWTEVGTNLAPEIRPTSSETIAYSDFISYSIFNTTMKNNEAQFWNSTIMTFTSSHKPLHENFSELYYTVKSVGSDHITTARERIMNLPNTSALPWTPDKSTWVFYA